MHTTAAADSQASAPHITGGGEILQGMLVLCMHVSCQTQSMSYVSFSRICRLKVVVPCMCVFHVYPPTLVSQDAEASRRVTKHDVQDDKQMYEVQKVHLLLVWSHISVEEGVWVLSELSS